MAIVLTHGLGDSADTWQPIIPALSVVDQVIAWDLRGHGTNLGDAGTEYSPEVAVADLEAIVEQLEQTVHLVGHSLGGYLSLTVALRRPELVASLTLIATGPGYRDLVARENWNRFVDSQVDELGITAEVAALCYQHDSFVIDNVRTLEPPLLLVVGERDQRFHAGMQYLAQKVPGSALHYIDDAGHHPQRTHAGDVARLITAHAARATVG